MRGVERAQVSLGKASKKSIISNEADLDDAIENIRDEVKEHLDKGKKVIPR